MPSNQQLKRRINSAQNIAQITKAMEAVAASKMKKSQLLAQSGAAYQQLLTRMTANIKKFVGEEYHPLLYGGNREKADRVLTLIIAPDRGLCGPLNSNLFRLLERETPNEARVVVLGQKAEKYVQKTPWQLMGSVPSLGDYPDYSAAQPASSIALEEFLEGRTDKVLLAYPKFINTLVQRPVIEQLLPIIPEDQVIPEEVEPPKYIFEPTREELLEKILPYSIHLRVYQAVLSAKAAEQSARMVAMKNASENAEEVRANLRLIYNKKRQQAITGEIADVVTASLALT